MSPTVATAPAAEAAAPSHADLANAIRALAMDGVERAKSGHPGMPMGMADVATVLFSRFLRFDPQRPDWPDRDRFILSAGHGSMLQYALLHLAGYPDMGTDQLQRFRQLGSRTPGHPEFGHTVGVETTTGPLGQGLTNAVGMALAERMLNARFGDDLVDHRTYVIAGDGCLMEGISHEAISLAGHLGLGRLIVLWDDNRISIDGPTSLSVSDDQLARFKACGWRATAVDGHDPEAVAGAIEAAQESDRPTLIACRTIIGYGAPKKQGTAATHGAPLGAEEIAGARDRLGWAHAPFEVPEDIRAAWAGFGRRGAAARAEWEARLAALPADRRAAHDAALGGRVPDAASEAIAGLVARLVAEKPAIASRKASQEALKVLLPVVPDLIGGSADLTESNLTHIQGGRSVAAGDFGGRYIHFGVREHAMAAVMNGIALHGGFIPYGGTFLVFTDYARPAIRLSALMGLGVVYVMTHDSIGLGEDGPTHQPVEHLAALRAIPGLLVFRPADAVETAECWAVALAARDRPSILALSRQNLPTLRQAADGLNHSARGAYVLSEPEGGRDVTLLATGSEVSAAVAARDLLAADGIRAAVVSMPSFELFEQQEAAYRAAVLGSAPRLAIEAAVPWGWTRYIASEDDFVGMRSFGASAPAPHLYEHFGVTAAALAALARAKLQGASRA